MGIPDEILAEPQQVPAALRCIICTEVFVEPVASAGSASASNTSCQHTFCLSCITRALTNKAECPVCREEMHALRLRRCHLIQALVDDVKVQCKYASSGCGWRGRLEDSATHQAVCPVVENLTLARKLEIANRRIGDLDNEKKTWQKETSALKAKLRSKEASVLHLQKENAVMLRQARESTTERNKMVARIKELQRQLTASPYGASPFGSPGMQVFLKEFSGRTRVIRIDPLEDISEIEDQIAKKTKINKDVFYLVCMGKVLESGSCAADYGVSRDSTLIMSGRLCSYKFMECPSS